VRSYKGDTVHRISNSFLHVSSRFCLVPPHFQKTPLHVLVEHADYTPFNNLLQFRLKRTCWLTSVGIAFVHTIFFFFFVNHYFFNTLSFLVVFFFFFLFFFSADFSFFFLFLFYFFFKKHLVFFFLVVFFYCVFSFST